MAIPVGTAVGYLTLDYSDFSRNLKTAVTEANGLSNKFADTIGSGLSTIGNQISTVGSSLTTAITLPLAAAAGASIKFGAEFDKGMSNVKAVSGATSEEFQTMRDAAISWGEKTVYTATEASDALYYMGLAGWDANDSVAALGPVLNLAAAGTLELGRTSDIVTDAMTALGLEADETTNGIQNAEHFTNVLAATMSNSNTDVDQMGEAFKYVAPLAGALGYKSEDLALALGNMANVGVKASQAGTGLRQALKNLITPANDTAAALMDKLGISLFDDTGKALEFKDVLDNLRTVFGGVDVDIAEMSEVLEKDGEEALLNYVNGLNVTMTEQEKLQDIIQIFGTRALPGVLGIINASEDKYNDLADAIYGSDKAFVQHGNDIMTYEEAVKQFGEELVNTSNEFQVLGAAEGMAMIQMDNLQGDWIKFTSALGTTKIEITDLVSGALREFVQKLTELVTWFNGLDDKQQKNILRWAAIAAAVGPVLLVLGKFISFIGGTITAISTISGAITKLKAGFSLLSSVLNPTIGALRNMFTILGPIKGSLGLLEGAISALFSPIGIIIGVVVLLTAYFVHLMKTNEDFRNKIISIWDGIKAKFEEAGQKIGTALSAIKPTIDSIKEALGAVFDWMSNILAPFFLAIFDTLSTTIGGALDIFAGFFEIIGGLFQGFRDGDWSLFTQGIIDFFGGLFDVLSTPFTLAFNVISECLAAFGTSWSKIWTGIKKFVYDIIMAIILKINEIKHNLIEFKNAIVQGFLEFHQNLWKKIGDFLYNIVMSVISFINNVRHNIREFFDNIHNKVVELKMKVIARLLELVIDITNKFNQIKSFIDMVISTIVRFVTNKFKEMKDNVTNKVTEIKTNITNKFNQIKIFIETVVHTIFRIVSNKFTEIKDTITNKIQEAKDNIVNTFNNIKETFTNIGSNIIDGIAQGIDNGWQWLKDKVSNLANSLFEAAKDALGISSPSRVFRDGIGYWLPLGAAEGVEKSMPKAVDQIQSAFDDGLSQVTGEVDIDTSTDSMIYSVQDAIEEVTVWFETVEERLSSAANDIKNTLVDIVSTGESVVTPDGLIVHTGRKSSNGIKTDGSSGGVQTNGETVNNYYYTFNSPKAIDEIEAARKLKETQRDLSEGF